MKLSFAGSSLLLLFMSVVLLVALTVFESALSRMSLDAQRVLSLLGLVLPAVIGFVLGVMSLVRKEGRTWLAIIGIVLNALFALFHLMIVLFAG
jgi:hypothetical protein